MSGIIARKSPKAQNSQTERDYLAESLFFALENYGVTEFSIL